MRLKTLAYTSLARLDLNDADLSAIHQTARHLNSLDGISGLLVFDGRRFLQIVEGTEEAIENLMGRLRSDDRHSAIEIRDERLVDTRSFPDWSMAFVRVGPGYEDGRREIGSLIPPTIAPHIHKLVLRMADAPRSSDAQPSAAVLKE